MNSAANSPPVALENASGEHRSDRHGDAVVIDLLRAAEQLSVADLARRLGVTATAIRQRLDRLMKDGLVERVTLARPAEGMPPRRRRGRPSHAYLLTEKGRLTGGDNFRDLALVLWREIRSIREPAIRQGLIARVGAAMAGMYRDQFVGQNRQQRLEGVAHLLRNRQIACDIEPASAATGGLPVLASYACPYPELAEQDRGICAAERLMFQELLGTPVELSACRLDGDTCCRFTMGIPGNESGQPASGTCNNSA